MRRGCPREVVPLRGSFRGPARALLIFRIFAFLLISKKLQVYVKIFSYQQVLRKSVNLFTLYYVFVLLIMMNGGKNKVKGDKGKG